MEKLSAFFFLCLLASSSFAQPRLESLRVATRLVKPFVFEENGNLTGFSVELWQAIAKQLNVTSEFVVKPTVRDLLASVNNHEANLGIAAISITAEHELKWDFSQPMFDVRLQILTPVEANRGALVKTILANLFYPPSYPTS